MRRLRLLASIALLAGVGAACGEDTDAPTAGERYTAMDADQVMMDLEHFITQNGVRRALLEADTAFMYEDSAMLRIRPVRLTLYDEAGAVAGEVTAERGTLNTRTDAMTATGNVVVISTEREQRIETEELHFDPNRDRVWSEVETTIHRNGTVLRGTGFESDAQLTNTRLENPQGEVEGLEFDL